MTNLEKDFWHGHKKDKLWHGILYHEDKMKLVWNWLLIAAVLIVSFYVGFWISGHREKPVDVPMLTGQDVIYQEEAALTNLYDEQGLRTIMLIGADEREEDVGRSDTLMLVFLKQDSKKISVLNIPRDTYVTIANKSQEKTKINHAFAYGGEKLTHATLENFLGIKIDNYALVNFEAFSALVDALGGVELEVPFDMEYKPEKISLKAGWQVLDGDEALQFVRFRSDGKGDIGRVERQQYFLKMLGKNLLDLGNIWKVPTMLNIVKEHMRTDLTTSEILKLVTVYGQSLSSDIETMTLPGVPEYIDNISYWVVDKEQIPVIIEQLTADDEEPSADGSAEGDTTSAPEQ